MLHALARQHDQVLSGTLLTAASLALMAASILWVIVSRIVLRNLRAAAEHDVTRRRRDRDIWKEPP